MPKKAIELLSKAAKIQATPESTLIQEGIDRWLPAVMGMSVPVAPKGAVAALRGLHRSIPLGKEVAEEAEDLFAGMSSVDPARVALQSRVTGRRIPHREPIEVPGYAKEFLQGPDPANPSFLGWPARPEALVERRIAQRSRDFLAPSKVKPVHDRATTVEGAHRAHQRSAAKRGGKLNEDLVRQMRKQAENKSAAQLAKDFGVSESTAKGVVDRHSWVWVK